MPRRCSSGSRSVSLPVSALTSHVLPWSMCPAVPTVRGTGSHLPGPLNCVGDDLDLVVAEGAAVEQEAPVADDADYRRLGTPERRREILFDGARKARELGQRQCSAAD